jgi:hypothetical protein
MQDLAEGKVTVETELIRSASRRLRELGFDVPLDEGDGARLYDLVTAEVGEAHAYSTYNALRRRVVSFMRAASRASGG